MKWFFKENASHTEMQIVISKNNYDKEVINLITYLEGFQEMKTDLLAIKQDDNIHLLKYTDIIAVEVDNDYLCIMTTQGKFHNRERLYKIKEKLPTKTFVQVSKQSIINSDHLLRMEASFSGNMLAILTNKTKIIISRRYLKNLERQLGL
ncbi:LytTR family transcriptional regulator [Streptococcus iniae]|uniref:LytTR family DNA-binding domain-containing protein n=1 Tax=Streptococcus iniae TaxID=1346 RepID=UPI0008D96BB0|nr:LytTR family DNA-binding domain-containing protein [Streptococcus iniae]OHX28414.1 DNA-binding protein [Streptococcus iniae]RLV27067.1 LytTR family transcriptional regulator [Streptococcus iniae]